jgi:effector-binding domain-containing protein
MTLYHDQEYKEEDALMEVAVPITGRVTVTDPEMEVRNLQPMKVVSLINKGPYETVGQAYSRLHEYMMAQGHEYAGPVMELYLSDPQKVPPEEILTEIQAPIKG